MFSDEKNIDMRLVCPKDVEKSWCRGTVQFTGRNVQPSTSMKSWKREHGSNQGQLSLAKESEGELE